MGCGLSGSSVHGISQARILEWVTIFFSRGIFPMELASLALADSFFTTGYLGSPYTPYLIHVPTGARQKSERQGLIINPDVHMGKLR